MTKMKKALIGTAAATAMAVSASPAVANNGYGHEYKGKNKIDAGDVIAGAVILGGLAAILTSNKKDRHYNNGYRHGGYKGGYGYDNAGYAYKGKRIRPRRAVQKCIRAAERKAGHYGGYADVTQIRDVDRTRYGWKVKGRIVVKSNYNKYDRGYDRYERNNRGHGYASYDRGRFTCYIDGRRVSDLRLRGLGNYR